MAVDYAQEGGSRRLEEMNGKGEGGNQVAEELEETPYHSMNLKVERSTKEAIKVGSQKDANKINRIL